MKWFSKIAVAICVLLPLAANAQTAPEILGKVKDPNCIYFAHPLNTYDTDLEKRLLARIVEEFPGKWVLNPNRPDFDAGVQRYIASHGNPMLFYVIEVLPYCTGGTVGLPMRDGMWTTGAYLELFEAFKFEYPIYSINADGAIKQLERMPSGALTIKESRERMRNPDKSFKPY
jgi:hypothetical protein